VKIIVGLGNPGIRYKRTRHNIGFRVLDELARRHDAQFRADKKIEVLAAAAEIGGEAAVLAKPQSYMNLSGEAVRELAERHGCGAHDLIVVVDDVALPLGQLRMRTRGSAGGHNGLKSIQESLGTDAYARLRIGIGSPGVAGADMAAYVLGRFSRDEEEALDDVIPAAAEALACIVADGIHEAMNRYNKSSPKKT